jgi:hypothetical protein
MEETMSDFGEGKVRQVGHGTMIPPTTVMTSVAVAAFRDNATPHVVYGVVSSSIANRQILGGPVNSVPGLHVDLTYFECDKFVRSTAVSQRHHASWCCLTM